MRGEFLIPIVLFSTGFAMVFGIVYLKTRQNMAMIEKGMNPKEFANRPAPYKNLKWALLLIGAGVGLFLAYMLDTYVLQHNFIQETFNGNTYRRQLNDGSPAVYFALIAIGGGLGLFGSYKMEKKWWDENKTQQ
jgi:membrane protease YdiL (CAAX protease family)